MAKPLHMYQTFIKAPAERVWEAMMNPEFTKEYFHAQRFESSLERRRAVPHGAARPAPSRSRARSRRSTRRGGSSSRGGCSTTRR